MKLPQIRPNFPSFALLGLLFVTSHLATAAAEVNLLVMESGSHDPLPCRVYLKDPDGKPFLPGGYLAWRDHFVCAGRAVFELAPGAYAIAIERGPEYAVARDTWKITSSSVSSHSYQIGRIASLAHEGWWSGDLHVHRRPSDIELLMRAEDLHVAPIITWWNSHNLWVGQAHPDPLLIRFDTDRYYYQMAGEDERMGGALIYFGLAQPLPIAQAGPEYPSPMEFVLQARKNPGAWVDVEKPFWYDVPVWLANGVADSIEIANNHMLHAEVLDSEAWGRARDTKRFPPPYGNGLWTQEIYYHILNCGFRIPPSAGSASGVLSNPVGYDRVYVHLDGQLTYERWWDGLRAGRSFVTNGPLLRVKANGQWPGYVFRSAPGARLAITLEASLDSCDPLSRIEIIKNGIVERTISPAEWLRTRSLGTLQMSESGWFLVRAIADVPGTFRFASTAPFYVEIGANTRRISRASTKFFLDWERERSARIRLADPGQQAEVMKFHADSERFWQLKVQQANAD